MSFPGISKASGGTSHNKQMEIGSILVLASTVAAAAVADMHHEMQHVSMLQAARDTSFCWALTDAKFCQHGLETEFFRTMIEIVHMQKGDRVCVESIHQSHQCSGLQWSLS